ncbi:MAG TPA: ribose-phosphate pyrophosphokinase [Gaiellaceae bacterium]|nr:ribose-phosphate pyrophosphokinase [Gaiellaceae bacterium]
MSPRHKTRVWDGRPVNGPRTVPAALRRLVRPPRRPQASRLMVFAGRSHEELAVAIAARLGIELGAVELDTFANGETYCRYGESVRGADVFLVQSCSTPVNDRLVELLVMANAARLASARRVTAVMPWFPYSRQDKKSAPREPITARLVADLLEAAGVDRVMTMDLHAGQIQGFFRIPVDHMTALPLFAAHFRRAVTGPVVAVSPDLGRVKLARRLATMLECDIAVVTKARPRHDVAEAAAVIGDVAGKTAVIGDDMIVTGGTLLAAADAVQAAGALEVRAFATHALFARDALASLTASQIVEVAITDTVSLGPATRSPALTVLSVADLLARSIENGFEEVSVSSVFAGLNELF